MCACMIKKPGVEIFIGECRSEGVGGREKAEENGRQLRVTPLMECVCVCEGEGERAEEMVDAQTRRRSEPNGQNHK